MSHGVSCRGTWLRSWPWDHWCSHSGSCGWITWWHHMTSHDLIAHVHYKGVDDSFAHLHFHTLLLEEIDERQKLVLWITWQLYIVTWYVESYHSEQNSKVFHMTHNSVNYRNQFWIVALKCSLWGHVFDDIIQQEVDLTFLYLGGNKEGRVVSGISTPTCTYSTYREGLSHKLYPDLSASNVLLCVCGRVCVCVCVCVWGGWTYGRVRDFGHNFPDLHIKQDN